MAGLLSQRPKMGGLLGEAPQQAQLIDYALAALGGGGLAGIAGLALQQRQAQRQYQQTAPVAAQVDQLFQPRAQVSRGMMGPGADGLPMGESIPQDQRSVGLASMTQAAPVLARAARMGLPIDKYRDLLKDAQPQIEVVNGVAYDKSATRPGQRIGVNLQNVNGFQVDQQNPDNANRFVPQIKDGAEPVYDGQRNVIGQRNMLGTAQTIGDQAAAQSAGTARGSLPYEGPMAEARAAGQGRGSAPYDLATVQGPDGQPMYGPRSAFLGGITQGQGSGDKTYGDKQAGGAADYYQNLQVAGRAATGKVATIQQVGKLLEGLDGGSLTPAAMEVARAANSFGIKLDPKLGNKEAAVALSNQIALGFKDLLPGVLTDPDREALESMAPNLTQSAEGRRKLVQIHSQVYQRQQDVAAKARQWQQRFGRIDKPDATGRTFEDYLADWTAQNRLFN